ncbi:hypothetical protein RSSM_01114 [Rhodopirellula sallentina SM41]|uniref:Uncharacterized protein n=1 Tax=Rhodopirellula sallentina SM41 TaxID=1263870 RepID=M5U851_9BACT|nr:hypothetical protein RSSM_01114 [Rhodopirellula sallentina SM41]
MTSVLSRWRQTVICAFLPRPRIDFARSIVRHASERRDSRYVVPLALSGVLRGAFCLRKATGFKKVTGSRKVTGRGKSLAAR